MVCIFAYIFTILYKWVSVSGLILNHKSIWMASRTDMACPLSASINDGSDPVVADDSMKFNDGA